jgi:hypothetical protein
MASSSWGSTRRLYLPVRSHILSASRNLAKAVLKFPRPLSGFSSAWERASSRPQRASAPGAARWRPRWLAADLHHKYGIATGLTVGIIAVVTILLAARRLVGSVAFRRAVETVCLASAHAGRPWRRRWSSHPRQGHPGNRSRRSKPTQFAACPGPSGQCLFTTSSGSIAGCGLSPVAVPSAGAILPRGAFSEATSARRPAAFPRACGRGSAS